MQFVLSSEGKIKMYEDETLLTRTLNGSFLQIEIDDFSLYALSSNGSVRVSSIYDRDTYIVVPGSFTYIAPFINGLLCLDANGRIRTYNPHHQVRQHKFLPGLVSILVACDNRVCTYADNNVCLYLCALGRNGSTVDRFHLSGVIAMATTDTHFCLVMSDKASVFEYNQHLCNHLFDVDIQATSVSMCEETIAFVRNDHRLDVLFNAFDHELTHTVYHTIDVVSAKSCEGNVVYALDVYGIIHIASEKDSLETRMTTRSIEHPMKRATKEQLLHEDVASDDSGSSDASDANSDYGTYSEEEEKDVEQNSFDDPDLSDDEMASDEDASSSFIDQFKDARLQDQDRNRRSNDDDGNMSESWEHNNDEPDETDDEESHGYGSTDNDDDVE